MDKFVIRQSAQSNASNETDNLPSSTSTSVSAGKKRKLADEWELLYFVTNKDGKPLCVICQLCMNSCKLFNIQRHYERNHKQKFDQISGTMRQRRFYELKEQLESQQRILKR